MQTKSKPYSREMLLAICRAVRSEHGNEPNPEQVLRWHVLKDGDGGVWLAPREPLMVRSEHEIIQWHPRKNSELPALPTPFDEYDLAAFFLYGGGSFLRDANPRLIGENDHAAREALIRALWWCRKALRRGFGEDGKGMHAAAKWIFSQAQVATPVQPPAEAPAEDAPMVVPPVSAQLPKDLEMNSSVLTTPELADAFDGIMGIDSNSWRTKLGDINNHQWLLPARRFKGSAPKPSTWCPLEFARRLLERGASLDELNRRFVAEAALRPWRNAWQEEHRERNAFGL